MVETVKDPPKLTIDPERILMVINRALDARVHKRGIFSELVEPPEQALYDIAQKYEQEREIEDFALHTFFFTVPTLFADNSTRQLGRVARPMLFYPHAWLFRPEIVARKSDEEVLAASQDLTGAGHNQIALKKWKHNATVLVEQYDGKVQNLFQEQLFNAPAILQTLKGPKKKESWPGFHRFGEKIGRLFLLWVEHYGLAWIQDTEDVGVPVDFQVSRLMIQTDGLRLEQPAHKHWVQDKTLTPFFQTFCKDHNLPSLDVSETLWLIGNRCCNNYRHDLCPLENLCTRMISREPLNTNGLFDPTDVGRWQTRQKAWAQKRREKQITQGQAVLFPS